MSTTVKAAPSTISGTCKIKCTTTIITPNAEFDVTIDGKVYKGHCLDPIYAAPLDGTYSYTGTLESDGG
ncbi:MAG: hypothetical protein PUI85_05780 [Eubacteriales bacterium]|nr:hypothetical protein [Eubacteriales bacterium]MDY3332797.1 hypothetical protein [Gallibacter sp.]